MAKRFTDTDIWDQDWFIELPSKYKLFWNYVKDKCDDSGVWRPNKSLAQRIIGEPINLTEFLCFCNVDKDRILELPNGRWFLKEYFVFQYGHTFNPKSNVHKGFLKRLIAHGLLLSDVPKLDCRDLQKADKETLRIIAYDKSIDNLLIEYGYPIDSTKDKDKDQAKDNIINIDSLSLNKGEEKSKKNSPQWEEMMEKIKSANPDVPHLNKK